MCRSRAERLLTLDHGDVVGAVADGEGDGLLVPLDELHHARLLQRRHATTYHSCKADDSGVRIL